MTIQDMTAVVGFKVGINGTAAKKAIDAMLEHVADTLKAGGEVWLPGIGTLHVAAYEAHEGRNPRTGEAIKVPAVRKAKFRQSSVLKAALNPPAPSVPRRPQQRRAG